MSIKNIQIYSNEMLNSENIFLNNVYKYIYDRNIKPFPRKRYPINNCVNLDFGVNKGEKVPIELYNKLQEYYYKKYSQSLTEPEVQTDIIVIGTGAAGLAATIEAAEKGSNVLVLTKDKFGLSNTVLAQGGIQVATELDDSEEIHFMDTIKGGHYYGKEELVRKMTYEAPNTLAWLNELGVCFKEKPLIPGGGTKKRLQTIGDSTGASIFKALKNRIIELKDNIKIIEYADVKTLLKDENGKIGGLIFNYQNKLNVAKAKSIVLATGGSGSLRYNNLETSNCKGSTADGLAIAYTAGAHLERPGDIQYHPTGGVYPKEFLGSLISEKVRALGGPLINTKGELLQYKGNRDDIVNMILNENKLGNTIKTPYGNEGIWLATPLIDIKNGEGTIEKRLPNLFKKYLAKGIDIRKHAILVYPTIHYHLGGIKINSNALTTKENLYAAGEVTGGIHGDNRLMGNALLDAIVYGRTAGKNASIVAKNKDYCKKLSYINNS